MSRPTKQDPQRGHARSRLLEAARDTIRARGFGATSVDELCRAAGVTKGAFFHHFPSKEAIGIAAAEFWAETTAAFFAAAPYHRPDDPLDRIFAYLDFRRSIIAGEAWEYSCLAGTMTQEVHQSAPEIRDACAASIFGHAATLEADFAAAMTARGMTGPPDAPSLARQTQVALQGGFILAKAAQDSGRAIEALDHLEAYFRLLFDAPKGQPA